MKQISSYVRVLVVALMGFVLVGCNRNDSSTTAMQVDEIVRTTSAPIDSITRSIVNNLVPVELLCPPDHDPSTWRPTPQIVSKYQRSRLIMTNGAGFEQWVQTAPLPQSRVVYSAQSLDDQLLIVQGETHSHGPAGDHAHDVVLGQVWLDPNLAVLQAESVTQALERAFSAHQIAFRVRLEELVQGIERVHQQLLLINTAGVQVIAPINPYGYLARRYGWKTAELSSNTDDWLKDLHGIDRELIADSSRPVLVLCEDMPEPRKVQDLYRTHGVQLVLWETGTMNMQGSYIDLLNANLERLQKAIEDISP